MLALLERCVADARGSYAFCDTDSMAIVATDTGGLIPCAGGPYPGPSIKALSQSEVETIVGRFAALNPYDRATVPGSVLKVEEENFDDGQPRKLHAYVISAKRYALFNLALDGSPIIRKYSEHGLGHLLNPTDPDDESRDWIEQLWRCIVRRALGQPAETAAWLDRPAISRVSASSPQIVRRLNQKGKKFPYAGRVKPFNFVLAALRLISARSSRVCGSGNRRGFGLITSAKCARTAASITSVFASRPLARANSRMFRALTTATARPS